MAKKEIKTDLLVARQLDDTKIKYDAQGSDVKEINDALQSASKRGTGNAGYRKNTARSFWNAPGNLPCIRGISGSAMTSSPGPR